MYLDFKKEFKLIKLEINKLTELLNKKIYLNLSHILIDKSIKTIPHGTLYEIN